ncbi:hypothetical protein BJV77DRAFT_1161677 [Russula vinacea]|nr:hypothetical protein BJV77DRAFT_1161677 [Russula vinacea]
MRCPSAPGLIESEIQTEVNPIPTSSYLSFLSKDAKARKSSSIRGLFPLEQTPGVISLLAGKPNAALFLITSVQFTAAPSVADASGSEQTLLKVDDDLLAMGLQYAPTSGITPMVLHRRPWPAHWPACVNARGLCAASTPPAGVPHQRSQPACCVNVVGLRAASTPPSPPLHRRPPPLTLE